MYMAKTGADVEVRRLYNAKPKPYPPIGTICPHHITGHLCKTPRAPRPFRPGCYNAGLDEPAVYKEHRGGRSRQRDGEGHDEDDMADGGDLGRLTHQDPQEASQAPPPQDPPLQPYLMLHQKPLRRVKRPKN